MPLRLMPDQLARISPHLVHPVSLIATSKRCSCITSIVKCSSWVCVVWCAMGKKGAEGALGSLREKNESRERARVLPACPPPPPFGSCADDDDDDDELGPFLLFLHVVQNGEQLINTCQRELIDEEDPRHLRDHAFRTRTPSTVGRAGFHSFHSWSKCRALLSSTRISKEGQRSCTNSASSHTGYP